MSGDRDADSSVLPGWRRVRATFEVAHIRMRTWLTMLVQFLGLYIIAGSVFVIFAPSLQRGGVPVDLIPVWLFDPYVATFGSIEPAFVLVLGLLVVWVGTTRWV